jgi:hypothetical protein
MDLVGLGSVTIGSVILFGMVASIAFEGLKNNGLCIMKKEKKDGSRKHLYAVDSKWNKVQMRI